MHAPLWLNISFYVVLLFVFCTTFFPKSRKLAKNRQIQHTSDKYRLELIQKKDSRWILLNTGTRILTGIQIDETRLSFSNQIRMSKDNLYPREGTSLNVIIATEVDLPKEIWWRSNESPQWTPTPTAQSRYDS